MATFSFWGDLSSGLTLTGVILTLEAAMDREVMMADISDLYKDLRNFRPLFDMAGMSDAELVDLHTKLVDEWVEMLDAEEGKSAYLDQNHAVLTHNPFAVLKGLSL